MKTGLFFGSFNPIHQGHLAIASYFVEFSELDQLWFVISPQNPLKQRQTLLDEQDRLEMLHLAIGNDTRFRVSDIEFRMPRPSYTIDTLVRLEERFPDNTFYLIMGSDTLKTLPKWKNYEKLINNYAIKVYPRHNVDVSDWEKMDNVEIVRAPKMEISAKFIRDAVQMEKSVKYYVPDPVIAFIEKWGLLR